MAAGNSQSMGPLTFVASLGVALLGAVIVLPWDSAIIREPFVRDDSHTDSSAPVDAPGYSRRTVFFPSQGVNLEAWLYLPKVSPPTVLCTACKRCVARQGPPLAHAS